MRAPIPQDNVAELEPPKVMETVEPDSVSVAEPVTVKLDANGAPAQVPIFVSVWLTMLAVKLIVPGTVIGGPETGVSVKLKLIVNGVPTDKSIVSTVREKTAAIDGGTRTREVVC